MGKSFKEYITALGYWGWVVLIDVLSGSKGAYLDISGKAVDIVAVARVAEAMRLGGWV